jgi:3-hydroxyisobutyrate dehydrogenase-like beta-hydroxyacid dehydrogenase
MAALAEAGVPAPTSSVVSQLVLAQVAAGKGEDDYSAIGDVIFELAHVRRQEGR